jgi:hypothetical protein
MIWWVMQINCQFPKRLIFCIIEGVNLKNFIVSPHHKIAEFIRYVKCKWSGLFEQFPSFNDISSTKLGILNVILCRE